MQTTLYVDDSTGKKYMIQKGRFIEVKGNEGSGKDGDSDSDQNKGKGSDQNKGKGSDQNNKKGKSEIDNGSSENDSKNNDSTDENALPGDGPVKRSKEGHHGQKSENNRNSSQPSKKELDDMNKQFQKEREENPVEDDYTKNMSDDDVFAQIKKLKDNPNTAKGLDLDNYNVKGKLEKEKSERLKKAQYKKLKAKGLQGDLSDFKAHIKRFIKNQIKQFEVYDPNEPDRRQNYFGDIPVAIRGRSMMKGSKRRPSINVYMDQSGSFGEDDIQATQSVLKTLKEFEDRGDLYIHPYYFGGYSQPIVEDPDLVTNKGTSDNKIREHILKTRPTNVIICTDSDISDTTDAPVIVPGGVWIMFRQAAVSEQLTKNIRGKKDNFYASY